MSVIRRRAVATPPGLQRNLAVLLVVAASAWLGVDSAQADFTLRCYDWRASAPWAARVYVSEGDRFVINLKWNEYSAGHSWVADWNTRRGSGGTATSDTDYEPRDDNTQTKRTAGNMNHTFSTVEDDRYEGDETYEAGYSFAGGGHDIDYHEYCPVTIEDDDDLKVDSAWFNSTPADGHTYRAGEWIEIAAKFNGRAAVDGNIFVAFLFHSSKGFQSRQVDYRRGSGTNTLVFGYQVDVRDRNVDYEVEPTYIQGNGRLYGVWTDGAHHREDTANRIVPDGYSEQLSVDGRRYVRSVSVTSRPRVGDTYGRGEKVEVQVTFDREVVVSGVPVVGLSVGSDYGAARYTSGSGTRVLTFHYEVGEGHTDTDGISIRTSNSAGTHGFVGIGSSITEEEFGTTANRAYSAQSNLSGHKVDGTVERAPSEPTGLTAGPATPTMAPLSWTAPKFDGATAVTGYKVEWSADGNDPWMVAQADTASTSTSYTHTGRTPHRGRTAKRLAGPGGAALAGVVDEHHGGREAALQMAQEGEDGGDVGDGILVDAMQAHQGVEDEQARADALDGLVQALAVVAVVEAQDGDVDDGDVEGVEVGAGGSGDAVQAGAHDVASVLGGEHQDRSGLVGFEASQARDA